MSQTGIDIAATLRSMKRERANQAWRRRPAAAQEQMQMTATVTLHPSTTATVYDISLRMLRMISSNAEGGR